jgi:hypothetical protein
MNLLGALLGNESGGRNIANTTQGTSSGQAQGYFQITTGTWNDFGGTKYAPTPLQATYAQQAEIASKIPLKRWDESTVAKMRATGKPIDPNKTLGENLAAVGEGFGAAPPEAAGKARVSGPVEAAGGGFGNEAAKAAPQLTNAPMGELLAAAVVANQPPPPNPLIDPGDSRGNLASAFTGMAAARGDGDSTGVGELPPPPDLPDVTYGNAVPGGGLTASGDAAVGALPPMDLGSLFKVAEIGVPQALASRRPKELYA